MSLPVCRVVCVMHDQAGAPVPGATFEFILNSPEVYEGYVTPRRTVVTADENGIAEAQLWPNQLGSVESAYSVRLRNPVTGKIFSLLAVVPNQVAANLHEITTLPPYPGKIDGQLIIEGAILAGQTAQTSAQAADASATNAAASAAAAALSAANALDSANAAADSLDAFDDRYLGAKASAPTLDNDGNALLEGALYWDSTAKEVRTWNGSAWVTTSAANAVSRTGDVMSGHLSVPAGATGSQAPRASEKVSKTGDTMTGPLEVPAGASGAQVPQAQEIAGLVRAMAVGTVSQSGGVPTGAIIEKGSNANGLYIRWASGTQICWRDVALGTTTNALGTLFTTASVSGSWPANFSATPYVVTSAKNSSGAVVWTANLGASTTGFSLLQGVSVVDTATANANLVAVGRWF